MKKSGGSSESRKRSEAKTRKEPKTSPGKIDRPTAEALHRALNSATSIDDIFGKEGLLARGLRTTRAQMRTGEMRAHGGYENQAPAGRNQGNRGKGKARRKVKSSAEEGRVEVPRDQAGTFEPKIMPKDAPSSNEREAPIGALDVRGLSPGNLRDTLQEMSGRDGSAATMRPIPDTVGEWGDAWPNRPLAAGHPSL